VTSRPGCGGTGFPLRPRRERDAGGVLDLTETFTFHDASILTFSADGAIVRVDDHVSFSGVITNNDTGPTYRDPGHALNPFDVETGVFTQVGLVYNITIPARASSPSMRG
jgi:hypothetical protein